jgi:hypothetical protein
MGWRSCVWVLTVLAFCATASSAAAATLLKPPIPGETVVAFGAAYEMAGRRVTHRGVDLQGSRAESVRAACDGVVTFVGEVPADGGGRAHAVTIRSNDGLLVCVSPLATTSVTKGEQLAAGDAIGELAESGDGSWSGAHLHLSVRDGDTYIDPAPLVVAEAVFVDDEAPVASLLEETESGGAAVEPATSPQIVQLRPARVRTHAAAISDTPVASPTTTRASVVSADGSRVRAAYATSIGVMRSPGRSSRAKLLSEMRFADSLERPTLSGSTTIRTLEGVGILVAFAGIAGVAVARKRLLCAARQLAGRIE